MYKAFSQNPSQANNQRLVSGFNFDNEQEQKNIGKSLKNRTDIEKDIKNTISKNNKLKTLNYFIDNKIFDKIDQDNSPLKIVKVLIYFSYLM